LLIASVLSTAAGTIRTCNSRFLRPPPLPLGYCGSLARSVLCAGFEPACPRAGRPSQGRAYASSASRAFRSFNGRRRELNPHHLGANQGSFQLDDGPKRLITQHSPVLRGGSPPAAREPHLHPRPSEGRARPIEL